MKRVTRKIGVAVVVLLLVGGGVAWYLHRAEGQTASYRTAEVKRDSLVVTIGATGTVEPEEVVDVGAQVAGQIIAFGKDQYGKTVDYGSIIEAGTVLAEIDKTVYEAEVAMSTAQLEQAKAGQQLAEADLVQVKAKLEQAKREWDRAQKLGPSEALAASSFDAYKSAYEIAQASIGVGEAAIAQARASVAQAEAGLKRAQRNLSYCTIKSPVKGVIIDRRVNIGQTVVASLNAPSLFLIAKDLTRMQVWVSVNEADIGSIRPNQPVTFTVDAYPGETFRGEVGKLRLNATMTQNVVTYTVEVLTDNSNGKLLPYLTANMQFEVNRRDGVLVVPNAALRWAPKPEQVVPQFRGDVPGSTTRNEQPGNRRQAAAAPADGANRGVVWARQGELVRPMKVRSGITDGVMTELEGEGLQEGTEIIIGEEQQTATQARTASPFTPQIPRRRGSAAQQPGAQGTPGSR